LLGIVKRDRHIGVRPGWNTLLGAKAAPAGEPYPTSRLSGDDRPFFLLDALGLQVRVLLVGDDLRLDDHLGLVVIEAAQIPDRDPRADILAHPRAGGILAGIRDLGRGPAV